MWSKAGVKAKPKMKQTHLPNDLWKYGGWEFCPHQNTITMNPLSVYASVVSLFIVLEALDPLSSLPSQLGFGFPIGPLVTASVSTHYIQLFKNQSD